MAYSQNGYKANDDSLVATYTIPGAPVRITLRRGNVSVVLLHFAAWFHKNIQPLRQKDTGGYAKRTIRGSSKTLSNHASGTAMDLRWQDHALGSENTFTPAQEKKIQKQLEFYDGVIRWGGNYKGRKDEMHFEINANKAAVTKVADKINPPTKVPPKAPSPPDTSPLEVDGQLGSKTIKRWQEIMKNPTGKTGVWSSNWCKFLQTFLKERVNHRLEVDGRWGPESIRALQQYLKAPVDGVIDEPKSITIVALQRRLNTGKF